MKNPLPEEVYLKRTKDRPNDVRGAYFRDQTAIIHSMPFRRLKHKTQVFFAPENDHVCTRIEHVMHVATIAKTICRGLNMQGWELDVELAFAIGLGHDLGHPPFGHIGEYALNKKLGGENAFVHEVNSYRVAQYLANKGKGLNLTYAVNDGIITHNGEKFEQKLKPSAFKNDLDAIKSRAFIPSSYEGCVVRFSDKIAYLGRDIEDAIVAGFIERDEIPKSIQNCIGNRNSQIIQYFVNDIIDTSKECQCIALSDEGHALHKELKDFNYAHIYLSERKKGYNQYIGNIINTIFDYLTNLLVEYGNEFGRYRNSNLVLEKSFGEYLQEMTDFYKAETNPQIIVTDYVAGMTDLYAMDCMKQITFPPPVFNR